MKRCFNFCYWFKKSYVYDKFQPALHFLLTNKLLDSYLTQKEFNALTSTDKELRIFFHAKKIVANQKIFAYRKNQIDFKNIVGVEYTTIAWIRGCSIHSFPYFYYLRTLNMSFTLMDNDMWKMLGAGISYSSMLNKMILVRNSMTAENAQSFFSSMPSNTIFRHMSYMDIGANNMGNSGTIVFAQNMWRYPSLHTFDSCSNKIGDVGIQHLAKALGDHCKQLSIIHFFFNNINEMGVWHMTQHLQHCDKIYMFDNYNVQIRKYNMPNIYWGV